MANASLAQAPRELLAQHELFQQQHNNTNSNTNNNKRQLESVRSSPALIPFTISHYNNPTRQETKSSLSLSPPRHSIYELNYSLVEVKTRCLVLSQQQLRTICCILEEEFKRGLHRDTNKIADIKMLPTHICDKPAAYTTLGHFVQPDEGKFLALDLGGTNFRVILTELEQQNFHMENETYALSKKLMTGPGSDLFDYIANCLHKFVERHNLNGVRLPLGFTFSFPCVQESLSHARLVAWTKGFTCSGVEGRDVCGLLREAIERRSDLDIEVMAVLNDTVGTLISCAHQNKECRVGLIVGTGTNACYMERVDQVHRMQKQSATRKLNNDSMLHNNYHQDGVEDEYQDDERDTTVVNTEWGAFGDNGTLDFVRTNWDLEMDAVSEEAGRQRFEKMIGGLYIGELCRRVIQDMAKQGLLFNYSNSISISSSNNNNNNKNASSSVDIIIGEAGSTGSSSCASESSASSSESDSEEAQDDSHRECEINHILEARRRKSIISQGNINKPFSFPSSLVSFVEKDLVDEYENTRQALSEAFNIDWASAQDCACVKLICARVTTRAAHLVAAAVACLLNKMQRPHTVVGVDGSMFRYHPHFRSIMAIKAKELTNPSFKFQLMFAEDGSGRGAAIMAAVACRQRRISSQLNLDKQARLALANHLQANTNAN